MFDMQVFNSRILKTQKLSNSLKTLSRFVSLEKLDDNVDNIKS
jgi:hypothetical protein